LIKIISSGNYQSLNLIKRLGHFDTLYNRNFIITAGFCQNIVFNILESAINGIPFQFRDINHDVFHNFVEKDSSITKLEKPSAKDDSPVGNQLPQTPYVLPFQSAGIKKNSPLDFTNMPPPGISLPHTFNYNAYNELINNPSYHQERDLPNILSQFEPRRNWGLKYSSDYSQNKIAENKKMIILEEGNRERFSGRLKFFDENKNYGFIIMDQDGSDIFVHYDDLAKADIPKDFLRSVKAGNNIRFSFGCLKYLGKYNESRKAVDIELIQ